MTVGDRVTDVEHINQTQQYLFNGMMLWALINV